MRDVSTASTWTSSSTTISTDAIGRRVFRSASAAESRSEVGIRLMATLGFLRRDFDVFKIDDFSTRLAKIDELVTPRLIQLAPDFNRALSRSLQVVSYPHYARHMRRGANPATETWAAFGPSPVGYARFGYLALYISGVGIHARAVVKSTADHR